MGLNERIQINVRAHICYVHMRMDYQLKTFFWDVPYVELWKRRRQQGEFESKRKSTVGWIFLIFPFLIRQKIDSKCFSYYGNGFFE